MKGVLWMHGWLAAVVLVLLSSLGEEVTALRCFSCSSNAGDRYCHEDSFNPKITYTVDCPATADVCVRAIQIANGNPDEKTSNAGAVFRSCGSTNQTDPMEELILGYYPPKNKCIVYKVY